MQHIHDIEVFNQKKRE
jgi:hypothetical protein